MVNQYLHRLLLILFVCVTVINVHAQDIVVDLNKINKTYESNFDNALKISFANAKADDKVKVMLKTSEGVSTLQESADLTNYKIVFTLESGVLTTKDSKQKDVKIAKDLFQILLGDDKTFDIKRTNNVVIDLKAASTKYNVDYKKDFQILFAPSGIKEDVSISTDTGDKAKAMVLYAKTDLSKLKIPFTLKGTDLIVNDEKGKDFKIKESPFFLIVGKQTFTVANAVGGAKNTPPASSADADCNPVEIIDDTMLNDIGMGGCQLCDVRSKKEQIDSRKDRKYTTDYIVIYDPLLKKDAYTICKHVFEKNKNHKSGQKKIIERYIKLGPKWFAPHVGSEILFEVINQPLNSSLKLSIDEQDVFNGGANQFSNLISSLVNANIITPVTSVAETSKSDAGKTVITSKDNKEACFLRGLDTIISQLIKYMTTYKISSCAVERHYTNLPVILSRIGTRLDLGAVSAEQLSTQLAQKIDAVVSAEKKVSAMKQAEAIVNALKALENVKPIAYTTLRAKNRDYIEVKYSDPNNVLSRPENIRMSGGMKIDFSAGFVLTGMRDYTYALKNATVKYEPSDGGDERDTTGNVIIKEDDGNNQIGVGILTHLYPRLSSHYNIGGTVGLMTSTNLNLRLMLGGSVMISSLFGSNNRVSFSGGVVWGKVKRLSKQNEDFYEKPKVVNNVPVFYSQASAPAPIDRNEHSWFFAVTMNFGGN